MDIWKFWINIKYMALMKLQNWTEKSIEDLHAEVRHRENMVLYQSH
jgi:hypothetical protein